MRVEALCSGLRKLMSENTESIYIEAVLRHFKDKGYSEDEVLKGLEILIKKGKLAVVIAPVCPKCNVDIDYFNSWKEVPEEIECPYCFRVYTKDYLRRNQLFSILIRAKDPEFFRRKGLGSLFKKITLTVRRGRGK